jgi:hypothetical protein
MAATFGAATTMSSFYKQIIFCRAYFNYGLLISVFIVAWLAYLILNNLKKMDAEISRTKKNFILALFWAMSTFVISIQVIGIFRFPICK